jgi:hypothetical protein
MRADAGFASSELPAEELKEIEDQRLLAAQEAASER